MVTLLDKLRADGTTVNTRYIPLFHHCHHHSITATTLFHHHDSNSTFHHSIPSLPPPFHHHSTTIPPPFHHRSTTTTPPPPLHCTIPSLLSLFLLRGKTQTSLSLPTLELVRIVACCPLRFDARSLFEVFLVLSVLSSLAALNVCDTK